MQTLPVNGYDMAYVERGTGPLLVLLHGSLLDQRYWAPQMEAFGQRYRVVAPSLRHYWPAAWDGVGDDFTIEQHVDDVATFIRGLDAGPVHLLGHSRGGHIAFQVARRFPDRVRALVLAEPGGSLDASLQPSQGASSGTTRTTSPAAAATPLAAERIRRGDVDAGLKVFVDAVGGRGAWELMAEHLRRMHRDNARTLLGQINERRPPFTLADAQAIRAPTLLVGGARTAPPFPTILDALERSIGDATRVAISGATHLMNEQEPEAFNRAVLAFLRDHG